MSRPFTRSPALRAGVRYGLLLGGVALLGAILQSPAADISGPPVCMLLLVEYTVALVLYFRAGKCAAAITGEVSSGIVAGLITGALASAIGSMCNILLTLRFLDDLTLRSQLAMETATKVFGIQSVTMTSSYVIAGTLVDAVFAIVISLLAGLALGAWGGSIGRRDAPPRPQPYAPPVPSGWPSAAYPWTPPPPAGPPPAP